MMEENSIPGIPKTERIWTRRTTKSKDVYITTSKQNDRTYYFMYKIVDGKAVKLGKSKSPLELDRKYVTNDN